MSYVYRTLAVTHKVVETSFEMIGHMASGLEGVMRTIWITPVVSQHFWRRDVMPGRYPNAMLGS